MRLLAGIGPAKKRWGSWLLATHPDTSVDDLCLRLWFVPAPLIWIPTEQCRILTNLEEDSMNLLVNRPLLSVSFVKTAQPLLYGMVSWQSPLTGDTTTFVSKNSHASRPSRMGESEPPFALLWLCVACHKDGDTGVVEAKKIIMWARPSSIREEWWWIC